MSKVSINRASEELLDQLEDDELVEFVKAAFSFGDETLGTLMTEKLLSNDEYHNVYRTRAILVKALSDRIEKLSTPDDYVDEEEIEKEIDEDREEIIDRIVEDAVYEIANNCDVINSVIDKVYDKVYDDASSCIDGTTVEDAVNQSVDDKTDLIVDLVVDRVSKKLYGTASKSFETTSKAGDGNSSLAKPSLHSSIYDLSSEDKPKGFGIFRRRK